jgi:hypothetical protein
VRRTTIRCRSAGPSENRRGVWRSGRPRGRVRTRRHRRSHRRSGEVKGRGHEGTPWLPAPCGFRHHRRWNPAFQGVVHRSGCGPGCVSRAAFSAHGSSTRFPLRAGMSRRCYGLRPLGFRERPALPLGTNAAIQTRQALQEAGALAPIPRITPPRFSSRKRPTQVALQGYTR